MPVTRDLSKPKRDMILKWLNTTSPSDDPLYLDIANVEHLKLALETAIMLEHSTIPVYLTAKYSIKPGQNVDISNLIGSIVGEVCRSNSCYFSSIGHALEPLPLFCDYMYCSSHCRKCCTWLWRPTS